MSNNSIYSLTWVTDPFDPDITHRYNMIIKALNGPRFTIITKMTTGLEQSIIKNNYTVKQLPGDAIDYQVFKLPVDNPISTIIEQIGLINFVPVIISTIFTSEDIFNTNLYLSNRHIVKLFTEILLDTIVDTVLETKYLLSFPLSPTSILNSGIFEGLQPDNQQYLISYTPYLSSGEAIYRKASHLTDLILGCDLNRLKGYQPIKYDLLDRYAIDQLYNPLVKTRKVLVGNKEVIFVLNGDENDENGEFILQVEDYVRSLRMKGYFSLSSASWLTPLYIEIAKMMKMIIHRADESMVFQIPPEYPITDFKMPIEQWVMNSAIRILDNKLPIFIVEPPEMVIDNIDSYSSLDLKSKLLFASFRAYYRMTHDNPILLPHITEIKVLPNYSIQIPIATLNDILKFKYYLPIMLEGMDQWLVFSCQNLLEGMITRWYIQQSTDLFAMVLSFDGVETVIINSPDNSKLVLSFDYSELSTEFLSYLNNYYQEEITLPTILTKVYLRNQWYDPSDPELTDLTEMEVAMIGYYRWGLRGLFSVHGLDGMIGEMPIKRLVSPPEGIISLSGGDSGGDSGDGDRYMVDVIGGDGKIIPLFEIRGRGEREMYRLLERLWRCGWFLSDWATVYAMEFNELSYALYRTQQLITAGESVEKSASLMDMLQRYSIYRC